MSSTDALKSEQIVELFQRYVVPNYGRFPVCLTRGEGSFVWDTEGNRYLDLFPGWGCNLLGHCPAPIVQAVAEQVATLIHIPNTWHIEAQGQWAKMLSERSFQGQAFFCSSGTEANEAAIKLARLHSPKDRYKIITFTGGFHGRTLGSTTATAQPNYHEGLGPLMAGFLYAPYGDLAEVERLIDEETCAILVEPVQGEGGVRIPPDGFLAGLRRLATDNDLLLMFDEVQTGCGRTGNWFAYQHFNVTPDVMTLAKSVCGGIAGGGAADDRRNRAEPPTRHACRHVRGQSHCRAGGYRNTRNDRTRQPARSRPKAVRPIPPATAVTGKPVRHCAGGPDPWTDDRHRTRCGCRPRGCGVHGASCAGQSHTGKCGPTAPRNDVDRRTGRRRLPGGRTGDLATRGVNQSALYRRLTL